MIDTQEDPIKVELEFEPGYLFACLPFLAEGAKMAAFSCVHIGDGWMGATDGTAALLIEHDAFKGCNYQLSGAGLTRIYDRILELQDEDTAFRILHFKLRVVSSNQAFFVINGNQDFEIELMAYPRIDLKEKDIPKPGAVNLTAKQMPYLDPYLMGRFMDAMSLYYGADVTFVRPLPTGLLSPIYIELSEANMHGLLMPVECHGKVGDFVEVGKMQ